MKSFLFGINGSMGVAALRHECQSFRGLIRRVRFRSPKKSVRDDDPDLFPFYNADRNAQDDFIVSKAAIQIVLEAQIPVFLPSGRRIRKRTGRFERENARFSEGDLGKRT